MNSKNLILSTLVKLWLVVLSFVSINSFAQRIEITPSYGFHFGTKLDYGPNYIEVEDSGQWGITLGVETFDDVMVELSYTRMNTELSIRDVDLSPSEQRLSDIAGDWILVGGTKYFPKGKIRPFAGGALGLVILSPSNENNNLISRSLDSETKFTFSFKGGVNIMFSEKIGLNIQGNLYFPVEWGGVYVGGGPGGVSGGVSTTSTTVIGGFSGGLVYRMK
ncbi:outer membrane beta-barrel protein [Psychroserpens sp.]|uniref:outer membrane beta-barrel protein n=1 Tax=Psychroserpens sp. TaxID=2020870 RepID=UPI001B1BC748|nr:outer membrane beta-barrel protein [Psychroserpens sp.]MBO6608052.1 outer membrane beta-barrel protein [Psychroserpens sp.]MBO6655162.1 outer membrane beta-barrel protein [Psychroserpens sp.]MBO6683262.1 outer membrane beta-barrel protein [Psychroserpens sp.]MBO6751425.1 outer membrane beta-barrel protein [Psychroserpens sp.]MBO6916751.1 outer membrane beta-barrel protein [Psychroserpens sp.]